MKFRSVELPIQLNESSSDIQVPTEVQLMRAGNYLYQGKEIEVTPEIFKKMIVNFDEKVRGIDLAIDYSHNSEDVAAGWIKKLYLKNGDTELWSEVTWTPNGRKVLSEKEFRYLSADFHLNFKNNETQKEYGPTLLGAGLTNRPFIKKMEPVVQLSEKGNPSMDEKDTKITELNSQIEALKKQINEQVQKNPDGTGDINMSDDVKKQMADLKKENEDLKAKNDAHAAAAAKADQDKKFAEKKLAFDKMLVEGKVVEAQRQAYLDGDIVKFTESAGKVYLTGKGSSEDKGGVHANAEGVMDEVIKLSEKHLEDKKAKTIGEAIQFVLRENPDLRKRYEETDFVMPKRA